LRKNNDVTQRELEDDLAMQAERETVGERIRRLREERGLSQRELAEPGVSYAYLSRIEVGQRVPSEKALRKLAAKLGVTPLYLEIGRDDATCPHCGRAP
jgi:ribosome-binding protein aMBF1 (putative translation factor)